MPRSPIGEVIKADGIEVEILLFEDALPPTMAAHDRISGPLQPGEYFCIPAGSKLAVGSVSKTSLRSFASSRSSDVQPGTTPRQTITGLMQASLSRQENEDNYSVSRSTSVPLGSLVYLPTSAEILAIFSPKEGSKTVSLGHEAKTSAPISIGVNDLLSRHVAVLGSTGEGKTHFIAGLLQRLVRNDPARTRIIIFDINGEYARAFPPESFGGRIRIQRLDEPRGSTIQAGDSTFRIPYYALGRLGLIRLLSPSEKTQLPALTFAIESLGKVHSNGTGAGLIGQQVCLYDDMRQDGAAAAHSAVQALRDSSQNLPLASSWPHMRALSCLAADSYAMERDRSGNFQRNSFLFGHISPLVHKTLTYLADPEFNRVVDPSGGGATLVGATSSEALRNACAAFLEDLFGTPAYSPDEPYVRIIDLSVLPKDLMPFILGALLEGFAAELFARGPNGTHPTLLVLEEAHHYLLERSYRSESDAGPLAYERLAKEGRKFNLSLLVSSQRPAEIAPAVLSQCATWFVFRLSNGRDQEAVRFAAEWGGDELLGTIPGLSRGSAVAFGPGWKLPLRLVVDLPEPDHEPKSFDAAFEREWYQVIQQP